MVLEKSWALKTEGYYPDLNQLCLCLILARSQDIGSTRQDLIIV